MRRSSALAGLSRDHHHALVAALRLTRATAENAADAAIRFVEFFDADGSRHFAIEERHLIPVALRDERGRRLADRVLSDHAMLRAAAAELRSSGVADVGRLHSLGARLREHVRLEEEELFVHLESTLSDDQLADLGRVLAAAEAAGDH